MEGSHQSNGRDEEQQRTMSITTTTVSIGDPWEVQYARFFNCPSRSTSATAGAHHPALLPFAKKHRGTWISSFASLACLRLLTATDHSVILTVTLVGNVTEEHYISKLNFTWPQVSCSTGFSPRGSKVVFMSYKDETGQIQKFVVRFLTIDETERFINFLKEAFGYNESKTSSESEIIPSFEAENRPIQDGDPITTSAEFSEPMYRPIQDSSPIENHDEKLSAFPPSFTSLLMNCFPVADLSVSQPTDPDDVVLKRDIMKYLEDSSFQDMLSKVQKVVNEFGDDLIM